MLSPGVVRLVVARRHLCCVLASGALFLTCLLRYWVTYDPNDSVSRLQEMPGIALNLSEKGQFANPFFLLNTGPSAHVAPAFAVFMALVIKLFGERAAGAYAIKLAAVLIVAFQVAIFPEVSSRLGMGWINGFIAACFWIVAKPLLVFNWEAFYAALLIIVTCCVYRRYLDQEPPGESRTAWLLGFLFGLLILTIPTFVPVVFAWLAWEIWRSRSAFLRKSLLPLAVLPAIIISPWVIRNYLVFHSLMIRDSAGIELAVSNNDCAQFSLRRTMDSGCAREMNPEGSVSEARKVLVMGEAQYNEMRLQQALHWIESHPVRFFRLTGMRFIAFWFPTENGTIHYAGKGRRLERVMIYLMTLLGIYGLVALYRSDIKSAALCISCLTLYPPAYYMCLFVGRYRYPILWMTFLLGALPITRYAVRKLVRQPID